jgi:hypothetical protein
VDQLDRLQLARVARRLAAPEQRLQLGVESRARRSIRAVVRPRAVLRVPQAAEPLEQRGPAREPLERLGRESERLQVSVQAFSVQAFSVQALWEAASARRVARNRLRERVRKPEER